MANRRNLNKSIRQLAMSVMGTIVRIAILAVCILFVSKAGKYAYDFAYRIFTEEPMSSAPGRDVSITVVQGDSLMDICNMLEEKGLVRDAKLTWIQKKVSVYDNDIQPGFYTLNTSMTAEEMFAIIAGKSSDEDEESDESEDETTTEAAPLTDSEVDMDSVIDSTIPDEDVVNNPYDEVEPSEDAEDGEAETEGDADTESTEE